MKTNTITKTIITTKLSKVQLSKYHNYLIEQEKSYNTIVKYLRDTTKFFDYIILQTQQENKEEIQQENQNPKQLTQDQLITKRNLIKWKEHLQKTYAPNSVNSMIAAINNYLDYIGKSENKISLLKIQKTTYTDPNKELSKTEYQKLINTAGKTNNTIAIIIQTIASTGIRVSELEYITIEGINKGHIIVDNKGKSRKLLLPKELTKLLTIYARKEKIKEGIIFKTKTGKPLNRSNIWRRLKNLCKKAGIKESKVFPHNFRKLFAKTFYQVKKDISKLADLLGHSNINTTRIYIMESGKDHIKQLDKMGMVQISEE